MAQTWLRAKVWTDTREVPVATLLQRTQGQYDEYRRQQTVQKTAQGAATQQKAAAVAAYPGEVEAGWDYRSGPSPS